MKTYVIPNKQFFAVKRHLDMAVFWKRQDADNVAVKPVFPFARKILEQIKKNNDMKP